MRFPGLVKSRVLFAARLTVLEHYYGPLEDAARDGAMDYERWPAMIEPLLQRLSEIVHHGFPIPTAPWADPQKQSGSSTLKGSPVPPSPEQSRKEVTNPSTGKSPRSLPPVPAFSSSTTTHVTESAPPSQNNNTSPDLEIPDQIISQLTSIQETLRTCFSEKPPHTIQRLAELVISPKSHYKTLPAWLRAVDRVVSVSSTADIFPLPTAQPLPSSIIDTGLINGITNGDGVNGNGAGILWNSSSIDSGLGSDESLGGALLTPIPWLMNREGGGDGGSPDLGMLGSNVNDDMLVPEREDGAVTQGELIRMEQEAGIVPVTQGRNARGTGEEGDGVAEDENEEIGPHARGPDIIGVEDMGLQNGHDVELQLNRGVGETESETSAAVAAAEPTQTQTTAQPHSEPDTQTAATEDADADAEGDVVLADADGIAEGDNRPQGIENVGPDAVDSTSV